MPTRILRGAAAKPPESDPYLDDITAKLPDPEQAATPGTLRVITFRYTPFKDPNPRRAEQLDCIYVIQELKRLGVPVIGLLWLCGVEHGELSMHCDGAVYVYTWTGVL